MTAPGELFKRGLLDHNQPLHVAFIAVC